jgi:ABC-type multidrug transport system permease subunit
MSQTVRMQHLVPATLVLALAATVTWLSFTREPADAFLFPRIISVVMVLLAAWNFARAALGLARVGAGFSYTQLLRLLPGVLVMCVYVFFAARWLGFYTASLATFVAIYALYDPAPHTALTSWLKRVAIAAIFIAIMYLLFSVLLKVQTPRGLFL